MANEKLHICDHPLVQHKVSLLRDKNTGAKEFRELVSEISMLMCYEATRDLPLKKVQIQTPVAIAESNVISGRKLAFVPILRAGLGMTEGVMALVPAAKIGHIGIFRGKGGSDKTVANEYYCKLPFDINERDVIVTDIMLATGTSAVHAIRKKIPRKTKMLFGGICQFVFESCFFCALLRYAGESRRSCFFTVFLTSRQSEI